MKNRQFIVFALLLACPLLLHGQETSLCGKGIKLTGTNLEINSE